MNVSLIERRKKAASIRALSAGFALCILISACKSEEQTAPTIDPYSKYISISRVESYYHKEPNTNKRYPLVQGSLTNLGSKTLNVVELTLRYRDSRHQVVYEEQAYPVYVSEFIGPSVSQPLPPGRNTRFAFKSLKCPDTWQPGAVDIEVSKVVFK